MTVQWILFDYGGVLAEEGFRNTFLALSERYGRPSEELPQLAMDAVYGSGYVTGQASEGQFWNVLRERFPFAEPEEKLSREILRRFRLRRPMVELVDRLRELRFKTAILSDQTDWLDKLDQRDNLFVHFDRVFNSYYLGKGKRDPSLFDEVTRTLSISPSQAIFIDDNPENIRRAVERGLNGIHYRSTKELIQTLASLLKLPADALMRERKTSGPSQAE